MLILQGLGGPFGPMVSFNQLQINKRIRNQCDESDWLNERLNERGNE